jgi:DNA-binding SARP family transcriptional activator/energy-coupling factor transporter ATP-binding protein EcfA2
MRKLKLFGIGQVLDGETDVKLRSRNWTLPLLAYVVLHATETVPRWRLAFTLWPDETEETALQNLRRNLHLLVKALPERAGEKPWLLVDAESIAWNTAADFELDVAQFEFLRADPARLEEAVAAYGGDLLEEIYDDWITAQRERLRQLYHADLTSLVIANRKGRSYAKAIAYAQRLLAADALREDTLRHLMAARYESGDAAGALAEYDRFARALATEMNAEPMPETIALRETIARGAPIPGTSDMPKAKTKRVSLPTPFVGRERELGQLRGFWNRAASGEGALVLVRGEAGIGKSRLVSELALIVEAEGGRVVEGTTSWPERGPYECVADALRQGLAMIAALPVPAQVLAAVAELVPELRARRPDLAALARLDERSERIRLFDAVGHAVVQLARPRPLLVILEDVQWADAATIELITTLAQRISGSPVLLIATRRDEQSVPSRATGTFDRGLGGAAPPSRVAVAPLDASAVKALADALAPAGSAGRDFARRIFERSAGNPLFATEMLRDAARDAYDPLAIPATVGAMIGARIDALRPGTKTLAQVAAVAGSGFAFDVVREVAGISDAEMLDGLDELLDRHLVRESAERGRFEYAFTHDLVRQAIYDASPTGVRARRHRRVGRVLANAYANETTKPAGEIARHYDLGGDAAAAARWYLLAAQHAASLYANPEARDLATRALELAPENEARLWFDLLLVRQEVNVRLGDREAHQSDLARLAVLSRRLDEESILTVLRLEVDRAHDWGEIAEEVAATQRFSELAAARGNTAWAALALELQARVGLRASEFDHTVRAALAAAARYEQLGDIAGKARALMFATGAHAKAGRNDDALELTDELTRMAAGSGDPWLRGFALGASIAQSERAERYASLEVLAREQLALGREFGHRVIESVALANLGYPLWRFWRIDEALAHYKASIAMQESMGLTYGAAALINCAYLLGSVGDYRESMRMFDQAEAVARRIGRPEHEAIAAIDRAHVLWEQGEIEEMRRSVDHATEINRDLPKTSVASALAINRARLLRVDEKFGESVELLEKACEDLQRFHRRMDEIVAVDELAATFLAANELQRAVAAIQKSTALAEALEDPRPMRNPVVHHWTAYRVYGALGDVARAAAELSAAQKAFEGRRDAIGDPSLRASFEAIPLHRELREALLVTVPDG